MKICFATNNQNKLREVQKLLPNTIELVALNELGHTHDLDESYETLDENALQKAAFVFKTFNIPCFADDTGLEVAALEGAPGVHSAHYSGERDAKRNMQLLLSNMQNASDRSAQFRTVIQFINGQDAVKFEGIVRGEITDAVKGSDGFGYDPIFQPEGYDSTFGEMDLAEKNKISHRARAVKKLVDYLSKLSV